MKSIPTIFIRDKATRLVINKPFRMIDWVFKGKGVATRKYDGVAVKVEHGKVYIRHEWKSGEKPLVGFTRLQDPDPKHPNSLIPGWLAVSESFLTAPKGVEEKAIQQAWQLWIQAESSLDAIQIKPPVNMYANVKEKQYRVPDGTYELCGPKIRGNQEKFKQHILIPHGYDSIKGVPRSYDKLKTFMETFDGEGVVWHYREEGVTAMAKIKRRDFGFYQRLTEEEVEALLLKKQAALKVVPEVPQVAEISASQ